jgi:hypothetical protein
MPVVLIVSLLFSLAAPMTATAPTVIAPDGDASIQQAVTLVNSRATAAVSPAHEPFDDPEHAAILSKAYSIQVPFMENKGQVNSADVRFYANTLGGTIFVEENGTLTYNFPFEGKGGVAIKEIVTDKLVTVEGLTRSSTEINYFKGGNKRDWKTGIPSYESISMSAIYEGIDLTLVAHRNNVEKIFTISPGATSDSVRIKIAGAKGLKVTEKGELELRTALGPVRYTKPLAYQRAGGKETAVQVAYVAYEGNSYGFEVGDYDRSRPLVIDPLVASTFIGGAGLDDGMSIALGPSGDVYVTGLTYSSDYPTTAGVYDESFNGVRDVFISRLDSNLTSLLESTFMGGSSDDTPYDIALDGSGDIYVTGVASADFPTTSGAYDEVHNGGGSDVFVSKLDGSLSSLLASTFIGGGNDEQGSSIAFDGSGNVYVLGHSDSSDYPTTPGAYDQSHNGGLDIVVSKLDGSLTSLLASTFIDGSGWAVGEGIVVDGVGDVYITGSSGCYGCVPYPTTPGAYDQSFNGDMDVFVSKLDGSLSSLLASTFIGGPNRDWPNSIAIDETGDVYVAGLTGRSAGYPTTAGAYDESYNGDWEGFVSRLDGSLSFLLASTIIGAGGDERGGVMAIGASGEIYVALRTTSPDYPTTSGAYDEVHNGGPDIAVSKLDGDLSSLLASTFIGGGGADAAISIAIDGSGKIYVTGYTDSPDYPTTPGAYDETANGGRDVFVSRLDCDLSAGVGPDDQSKQQRHCINTMNKNMLKVASRQGKEVLTCIKNGSKGRLDPQTIEECLTADSKGKVAKAKRKTIAKAQSDCAVLPDFGPTNPNTVNDAAVQKELGLIHAIFDFDLDSVIVDQKDPHRPFTSKCQQKVASQVKKCQDTKLRGFNECKMLALKNRDVAAADLEACIFVDLEGDVAKACIDKVRAQVRSHCVLKEVDLADAFPGIGLSDPNALVDALDQRVECLSCLALNEADALKKDCDLVDDGIDNESCPPVASP